MSQQSICQSINQLIRRVGEGEDPRIKSLGKIGPDDCEVFLVDGKKVRDDWNVEFVLGGHSRVGPEYGDSIPEGEIWVEDTGDPQDLAANVVHEIVERIFMKFAGVEDYEEAHQNASSIEEFLRGIQDGGKL